MSSSPRRSDRFSPALPKSRPFKSVNEMLTDELRRRILSAELKEGEYLRQRGLAQRYSVSEVVVREAVRRLEAEGLVEVEARRGARIGRLSAAEHAELSELRILVEVLLTKHAVPAATAEDLRQAAELITEMQKEREIAPWMELNREFHNTLYRPASRPRTLRFSIHLRHASDRYLRMRIAGLRHFEIANREHRQILAAYRTGSTGAAMRQVRAHLQRTAEGVVAFLHSRQM